MGKNEGSAPTILVIFGVSGDLAQRYLLPSLSAIKKNGQLPPDLKIVGISRRDISKHDVLSDKTKTLAAQLEVYTMDVADSSDYSRLKVHITELKKDLPREAQVIFYFAVPPAAVLPIIRQLGKAGLNDRQTKLLLEKPFGTDYESASDLISETNRYFKEEQVYRIDHYLAKEMAQNIAVFLGSNVLFRDVWNNKFIEKIDIIASEKIDIEGRVHFYEQSGALRDLVQSHLLQIAALVLMHPCPDVFDFSQMRQRRYEAMSKLRLFEEQKFGACVLRAQYSGYRDEVENQGSLTETLVSLKLKSEDARWQGVPIRLSTGKALDKKCTEVRVYFKKKQEGEANRLTLRIQPQEGIELDLWVKKPGYDHELAMLPLDFNYEQYFGTELPEAYEQVIVDAIRSKPDLFASSDEVLAAWKILEPIQKRWQMHTADLKFYKKGSSLEEVLNG